MYKSEIIHSWRNLSKIEKFNIRDTSGAIGINDLVNENDGKIVIEGINNFVKTHVFNDMVKDGNSEYDNYFLIDKDGTAYYTSSETLASDLESITDIMDDDDRKVDSFSIIVKVFPSKNQRQGFMKASLKAIVYEDGEIEE